MKKLLLVIVLVGVSQLMYCQTARNQRYLDYIDQYKNVAIREMLQYNIPASITLAQGLLESGAGGSELSTKGNNHFGIKCHGWQGRAVYYDDDAAHECFRAYDTALESYEDHSQFLMTSPRYAKLFYLERTDYKGWAYGLKAAGYATNPRYANNLISIIEQYELYQYDTATNYAYDDPALSNPGEHQAHRKRHSDGKHQEMRDTEAIKARKHGLHTILRCNDICYVVARYGDTFKSISDEVMISAKKLAKYNERNRDDQLSEGDIIYLKTKKNRADESMRHIPHVVKAGESMYTIAQKYGIKLKALYKLNDLPADYQLQVGDKLRVY